MKLLKKIWHWILSFFKKAEVIVPLIPFSIGGQIKKTPVKRHAWFKTSDGRKVRKPI